MVGGALGDAGFLTVGVVGVVGFGEGLDSDCVR